MINLRPFISIISDRISYTIELLDENYQRIYTLELSNPPSIENSNTKTISFDHHSEEFFFLMRQYYHQPPYNRLLFNLVFKNNGCEHRFTSVLPISISEIAVGNRWSRVFSYEFRFEEIISLSIHKEEPKKVIKEVDFSIDTDNYQILHEINDYDNYHLELFDECLEHDSRNELHLSLFTLNDDRLYGSYFSIQYFFRQFTYDELKDYTHIKFGITYMKSLEYLHVTNIVVRIPKTKLAFEYWLVGLEQRGDKIEVTEFSDKVLEDYANGNPDQLDGFDTVPEITKIILKRKIVMKNHVISNIVLELPEGMSFTNGDFSIEVIKKDKVIIKNGKVITTVSTTEAKEIITKQCEGKMFNDLPKQIAALISETTFVTEITYKLDQSKLNLFN